ncbi:transposase IS4 family protein [Anopheles sinensis]|uniref:Transposase IS4 family protein n=1 Tax=Anopheles sinensis TaxID=74873 RepID=A0A084VJ85_ANOSI|nr:transposase IS4 family protein [Anopheles sinensis]
MICTAVKPQGLRSRGLNPRPLERSWWCLPAAGGKPCDPTSSGKRCRPLHRTEPFADRAIFKRVSRVRHHPSSSSKLMTGCNGQCSVVPCVG